MKARRHHGRVIDGRLEALVGEGPDQVDDHDGRGLAEARAPGEAPLAHRLRELLVGGRRERDDVRGLAHLDAASVR